MNDWVIIATSATTRRLHGTQLFGSYEEAERYAKQQRRYTIAALSVAQLMHDRVVVPGRS